MIVDVILDVVEDILELSVGMNVEVSYFVLGRVELTLEE